MWNTACGCPSPAITWSSDFNARFCNNCGVVITEKEFNEKDNIEFVHLRVHTYLSFLQATCKTSDLIQNTKRYNMNAVAKTEFNNMCGVPTFVKNCIDNNIKPIVGVDFTTEFMPNVKCQLTIIALNGDGYKQLVKLSTIAQCDRFVKNKIPAHINISDIPKDTKDKLVILIDLMQAQSYANIIVQALNDINAEIYLDMYSDNEQYVTLIDYVNKQFNVDVVVTGNVLYLNENDKFSYGVGLKINRYVYDYVVSENLNQWFKPPSMMKFFGINEEWIKNSVKIANRVEDYGIVNKEFIVPTFKDNGREYTDLNEVHKLLELKAWSGLYKKKLHSNKEYCDRLTYELNIMKDKKFSSYFLIIAEIIDFMKSNDIMAPVGRGSSVGSLVCYCLEITALDPIRWNIPFERFINSGRKDLPDIDTDISQERRGEVLNHIANIHGGDRVAHICTYQTLKIKAAIENVGRALQVPHSLVKDLKKIVPEDAESWDDIDDDSKNKITETMSFNKNWLETAQQLTGTSRNYGLHAAGVVISNTPLNDLVPFLQGSDEDNLVAIQYDMHDCEVLGLLKLDMLGLRNIDIIHNTLKRIYNKYNLMVDIYNLPFDDNKTFDLISKSDYVSVFQLDSTGYRRLCGQLKPRSFEHIMALNALFRPGPLESGVTQQYTQRRHGLEEAVSWHPWLDSILSDTYQTVLYQEQAMAMSRIIAGFSDVQADEFRKGIGKKKQEVVDKCLKDFKDGAMQMNGLAPPATWNGTLELWIDDLIQKLHGYARYMWNRGHCLSGDSLVLTCNRGLVPIKNIEIGEEIWSVREDSGDLFRNRVINVINNGIRDTVTVESVDGRSLCSTGDHGYFTSKHQYINASKLVFGDQLKMFNKWTSDGNFNILMTGITDTDQVPFWIRFNYGMWNYMMKCESIFRSTKDTFIIVSIKKLLSGRSIQSIGRIFFNISKHFTSNKFIDTFRINNYISFFKDRCNSMLSSGPTIIDINNLFSNIWSYCVDSITTYPPLFKMSGERSLRSSKWEFFNNFLITMSEMIKFNYKIFVDVVRIGFSRTDNTFMGFCCPSGYLDFNTTILTGGQFGVKRLSAIVTNSSNSSVVGDKSFITDCADDFSVHNPIFNRWNIPAISNITVASIKESNKCEVWDLTMAQDPNFIANGFVVHNSAGYGLITYITAYLESHYPQEYYASLLDGFRSHRKKLPGLLRSIKRSKICDIIPPNINESDVDYAVGTDGNIYMGLGAIAGVGKSAPEIVEERKKNGLFKSFIDFCQRMLSINKNVKVALVKAGAFTWDRMLCDRDKIDNVDVILKWTRKNNKSFNGSTVPALQIAMKLEGVSGREYTEIEKTSNEKEVLNAFITNHPADVYQEIVDYLERGNVRILTPSSVNADDCTIGENIVVIGMVDFIKKKYTKADDARALVSRPYLNIGLSDIDTSIISNVWWPLCDDLEKLLVENQLAMLDCKVIQDKYRDDGIMIKINNAINISNGLPVQGVFRSMYNNASLVVNAIGGNVNNESVLGTRKYVSIRGRITVLPDVLLDAVNKIGDDIKFLISMDATNG